MTLQIPASQNQSTTIVQSVKLSLKHNHVIAAE